MNNKRFGIGRKGSDTTISIYWFAILAIVSGAVIYMVGIVYGQPYDVRDAEAEIMASNIADCMFQDLHVRQDVLSSNFQEKFLYECKLNFKTEEILEWQEEQYYAEVNIYDFESNAKISGFSGGNVNLKQDCTLSGEKLSACTTKNIYGIDESQKKYKIEITSIVRKTEKNAQ